MADSPSETFRRWAAANVSGDAEAWASVVDDGFTYVHSRSNLETKPEMVEAFKNGRRYGGWDIEEMTERSYPGCAILNGIAHLQPSRADAPRLDLRFTATLVPAGDGWQLAAMQTTRLQD